jgi:SAM-dependent methyltransferase
MRSFEICETGIIASMAKTKPGKIAFDRELRRGIVAYNGGVGRWWLGQSDDFSHRNAYRHIVDFLAASFPCPPKRILDYACGAGHLIALIHARFPDARITGLDGSSFLLGHARRRQTRLDERSRPRLRLVETALPNFRLPRARADLVTFIFPNMLPDPADGDERKIAWPLTPRELDVARELAQYHDPESTRGDRDPEVLTGEMLWERLISCNLRHLLRRGGICVRAEYGNVPREQLSGLETLRTGFEEGSLDYSFHGTPIRSWFRIVASRYYRSGVVEDVFHQSPDTRAKRKGGYLLTVLRAC